MKQNPLPLVGCYLIALAALLLAGVMYKNSRHDAFVQKASIIVHPVPVGRLGCSEGAINAAIRALPAAGGIVHLASGDYTICRVEGSYGGIVIDRSNVILEGEGYATRLKLADGQFTNVIRIIGQGVRYVRIRSLAIDGNREGNPLSESGAAGGVVEIPHSRFEICGIKAHYVGPDFYERGGKEDRSQFLRNIYINNVHVKNSAKLNIMLSGENVAVTDSHLGDSGSESVELLFGPGSIQRNTVTVREESGFAIGTDAANFITIHGNMVVIKPGAYLREAIRTWADSIGHIITSNQVVLEEGGKLDMLFNINGSDTLIANNLFYSFDPNQKVVSHLATAKNNLAIGNIFHSNVSTMHQIMPSGPFNIP